MDEYPHLHPDTINDPPWALKERALDLEDEIRALPSRDAPEAEWNAWCDARDIRYGTVGEFHLDSAVYDSRVCAEAWERTFAEANAAAQILGMDPAALDTALRQSRVWFELRWKDAMEKAREHLASGTANP